MTVLAHRLQAVLRVHPGRKDACLGRSRCLSAAAIMIAQAASTRSSSPATASRSSELYLLVGIAMFLTTVGVGALLARVGRERVFVVIPAAISVAALVARGRRGRGHLGVRRALDPPERRRVTCLLAIWGSPASSRTRQAKRFFPLIAAGGVGLIVGGLATALAATRRIGEPAPRLGRADGRCGGRGVAARLTRPPTAEAPRTRRRRPVLAVSDVRASPLLRWMSAGALYLAPLQPPLPLLEGAAERYPDADDLAAFFGVFFALSMGTALVLSLLVTSRLLGRFGVPTVVLVLPVLTSSRSESWRSQRRSRPWPRSASRRSPGGAAVPAARGRPS